MTDTIDNICFFDTETRAEEGVDPSDGNVKTAGAYRYTRNAFVTILTYAIGEGPVKCVALDGGFDGDWMCWKDMPLDLRQFYARATQGLGWFASWNAGFDRAAWNNSTYDFPELKPERIIDIMAQATASNLPPSLEGASKAIGRGGKQTDGKQLIALFCHADSVGTPQTHPEEWERFKSYAVQDTAELREVFRHTRPLSRDEWEDYWVNERINDRGMAVDLDFCRRAAAIADLDRARSNRLIAQMTGRDIEKITQAQKLAEWIYDRLTDDPKARDMLVKEYDEESEDDLKPARLSIARDRIAKLVTYFNAKDEAQGLTDEEWTILQILELREFGASASPYKFGKVLRQHTDGRLRGQYVFNGANQTGRFSSRGVQIQNLVRKSLGKEGEVQAIEMINDLEI